MAEASSQNVPLGLLSSPRGPCAACGGPCAAQPRQCAECRRSLCGACLGPGARYCAACEADGDWDQGVLRGHHAHPHKRPSLSSSPIKGGRKLLRPSKTFPSDVVWMPNAASETCVLCDDPFTRQSRRHHCRHCLRLVCQACSSNTALLVPDGGSHLHLLSAVDEEEYASSGFTWRQFLVNWKDMLGAYDGSLATNGMRDLLEEEEEEEGEELVEVPDLPVEQRVCDECFVLLLYQHPDAMRELSESDPALAALVRQAEAAPKPSRPAPLGAAMSVRGLGGPEALRLSRHKDLNTKMVQTLQVQFQEGPLGLALRAETADPRSPVAVLRCVPGGQAARLGVKPEMLLVTVDGEALCGMGFDEATGTLREAVAPVECVFTLDVDGGQSEAESESGEEGDDDDDDERLIPSDGEEEGDYDAVGDMFPKERLPEKGIALAEQESKAWMSDSSSKNCLLCRAKFTLRTRRHHCRKCLRLVCHSCSERTLLLPLDSDVLQGAALVPQRVCDECFGASADEKIARATEKKGRLGLNEATVLFLDGALEVVTVTTSTTVESLAATVAPHASVALMRATGELGGPKTRFVAVPQQLRVVDVLEHWRACGFEARFVCPLTSRSASAAAEFSSDRSVFSSGGSSVVDRNSRFGSMSVDRPSVFLPPLAPAPGEPQQQDGELLRELSELREKCAMLEQICRQDSIARRKAREESKLAEPEEEEEEDDDDDDDDDDEDDEDADDDGAPAPPPAPATAGGVVVQGWLMKRGKVHKAWKQRYCVLDTTSQVLSYFKAETSTKPKGRIDLSRAVAVRLSVDASAPEHSIDICLPKRTYALCAASEGSADDWIDAMRRCVGDVAAARQREAIPEHRINEMLLLPRTLAEVAKLMRDAQLGVAIKDRMYMGVTYPRCFVGKAAVDWMLQNVPHLVTTRLEAVQFGQSLVQARLIRHVSSGHDFKDDNLFYEFLSTPVDRRLTMDVMLDLNDAFDSFDDQFTRLSEDPRKLAASYSALVAMQSLYRNVLHYGLEWNRTFKEGLFAMLAKHIRPPVTRPDLLSLVISLVEREGLVEEAQTALRSWLQTHYAVRPVEALDYDGSQLSTMLGDATSLMETLEGLHGSVTPLFPASWRVADLFNHVARDMITTALRLYFTSNENPGMEEIITLINWSHRFKAGMAALSVEHLSERFQRVDERLRRACLGHQRQLLDQWVGNIIRSDTAAGGKRAAAAAAAPLELHRAPSELDLSGPLTTPAPGDVMRCLRQQVALVTERLTDAAGVMEELLVTLLDSAGAYVLAKRDACRQPDAELTGLVVAANNLTRYAELLEEFETQTLSELGVRLTDAIADTIARHASAAVDASVVATSRIAELVVHDIEGELVQQLFLEPWLENTHTMQCVVATLNDFFQDLRLWLVGDYSLGKVIRATLHRFVVIYANRLLNLKRACVRHAAAGRFRSRIQDDVDVLESYFLQLPEQLPPSLIVRQLKPVRLLDQLFLRPSDALPTLMDDMRPVFGDEEAVYVVAAALGHRPDIAPADKAAAVQRCLEVARSWDAPSPPDFEVTIQNKESRLRSVMSD